jgi:endoglucanase
MSFRTRALTAAAAAWLGTLAITAPVRAADAPPATQPATAASASPSLLSNGSFTDLDATGWPTDWPKVANVTAEAEGDVHFLRFTCPGENKSVIVYRRVRLPDPPPPGVELRIKVRFDVTVGVHPWFDARVMSHFKTATDKVIKGDPPAPAFHGKSKDWVTKSMFFRVPKGAAVLEVMPSLLQVTSGTLDLAECEVLPATEDQLPKPPPIIPSDAKPAPTSSAVPPELHVVGNQLETAAGKPVVLQGLCLDSLEWSAKGEHLQDSIPVAIEQWKSNAIRLPINSPFWWGVGGHQYHDVGGLVYRTTVDTCIDAAVSRGAYLVLDLHRFGRPTADDVAFWKDAALRYKNNPAVIYEIFNEPHSMSWPVWQHGGKADDAHKDTNAAENTEDVADEAVGMQALVDAVRSTGAHNLIVAGGIDWSYDLSGVVAGYALHDVDGADGIMYSSHNYPWKKNWQHNVLDAAAKYPIFVGEVGCPEKWSDFKFIPKSEQYEKLGPGCTWPTDVIGMMQKYKLNWTGFSFHPKCGPMVIKDWTYAPTDYWGVYVKDALAGKQFEMQRLR